MRHWEINVGDALSVLRTMADESVHCVMTSPPYWGLRSYHEDAVTLDPSLDDATRDWVLAELEKRGVDAKL